MDINNTLYFEDVQQLLKEKKTLKTKGRTILQSDIMGFAGLTSDYSQIHTNFEFAKNSPYKKTIAHGLLGLSYSVGLAIGEGWLENSVIAFESITEWNFKRPIFPDDTIHCEMGVLEVEERKIMRDMIVGWASLDFQIKNQRGKVCQRGKLNVLLKKRES